jgi:hypothetical protein
VSLENWNHIHFIDLSQLHIHKPYVRLFLILLTLWYLFHRSHPTPTFGGILEACQGSDCWTRGYCLPVIRRGKKSHQTESVWRNPCTGSLMLFHFRQNRSQQHPPFSSSEMHQHMSSVSTKGSLSDSQSKVFCSSR